MWMCRIKICYTVVAACVILILELGNREVCSSPCPTLPSCDCSPNSNKVDINCKNVTDLNDIRRVIRIHSSGTGINKLTLYSCTVKLIRNDFLGNVSISQFISYCPLEFVEDGTFSLVRDLLKIILQNSNFTSIPVGMQYVPNLKTITIRLGSLEELDKELYNLTELNYLTIHKNKLSTVSRDAFVKTPRLVYLELSNNKLTSFKNGTFDHLTRLRTIILAGNQLFTLDGAFNKLDPENVDVSLNNLTDITDAFHDQTSSIKKLVLKKNFLQLSSLLSLERKTTSITTLDISACRLQTLEGVLSQFPFLRDVFAGSNNISELPRNLLRNMRSLYSIDLSFNKITSVEGIFEGYSNLRRLALNGNRLTRVESCFTGLPFLENLLIHQNKIVSLADDVFSCMPRLRTLHLSANSINRLDRDCFSGLNSLEELYLKSNHLTYLNDSLRQLRSLTKLTVNKNYIISISETDLSGLHNLPELDLHHNKIKQINGAFRELRSLKSLNLAKNKLRTISRDTFPKDMRITKLWLAGGNKWECDCRLLWLLDWYHKTRGAYLMDHPNCLAPKPRLYLVPFRTLNVSDLTDWPENCSESCSCHCRPQGRDFFVEADCSNRDLEAMPDVLPDHLGTLLMNNNSLTTVSLLNFTALQPLRVLSLSNNLIEKLDGQLPKGLRVLNLDGNRLKRLPRVLEDIEQLEEMTLSRNSWACDCGTRHFRKWLLSYNDKISDVNDTRCGEDKQNGILVGKAIVSLTDNDLCPSKIGVYVATALGAITLLFVCTSIGLLYFRYGLNVKVWLYSRGLTWVKEDENDQDKIFDAMVSCSEVDLDFAIHTITEGLENHEPYFTICLPIRDIMVGGNEIVDKLTAISKCRRIIFILSRAFLEDEFCMELFRSAFAIFLEEKVRRIIVVKYGDLPSRNEMDPSLKAVLESSDTLRWREKMFWPKLRYAMPKIAGCHECPDANYSLATDDIKR